MEAIPRPRPFEPRHAGLLERAGFMHLDVVLIGAALALIAFSVITLVVVLMLGEATRGSRRWIELPFFTFQPSELGKVLLIVAVAAFAIDTARRVSPARRTARLLLLGTIPALLVFMQPDLGTGAVYVVVTLAVMFIAGVRWTHFAALGGIAA